MEKRISDLVAGFDVSDIGLRESDVVSADRIKEITMKKINENTGSDSRSGRMRLGRAALIAAAVVMLLGITAGAHMGFVHHDDPVWVLESFFNQDSYARGEHVVEYETIEVDGEVYEKLKTNMPAWERMPLDEAVAEKYIYPYVYGVGESITWEDYTLTVEAMVYDAPMGCGLLYYTVENPNGVEGFTLQPNGEVDWPTSSPWYVGFLHPEHSYIDEEQTTDTKIYLCSHFVKVDEWGDFELRIGNGAEFSRGERETMHIELPGSGLESLSFDDGNVVVSPIGMSVDKAALGLDSAKDIDHITIRFTDGSEYIVEQDDEDAYMSNSTYSVTDSVSDFSRILFNSVVDIDKVSEVDIEDHIFRVE